MDAELEKSRKTAAVSDTNRAAASSLQDEYHMHQERFKQPKWNALAATTADGARLESPSLVEPIVPPIVPRIVPATAPATLQAPERKVAVREQSAQAASPPEVENPRLTLQSAETKIEIADGVVKSISGGVNGANQLRFEYKKDLTAADGELTVSRMVGVINGQKIDLDGQNIKIRVAQRGDEQGNITIEHPGGKYKEAINARDFLKETYQSVPNRNGGSDWRFVVAVKPDGPSGWENGSRLFPKGDTIVQVQDGLVCKAENASCSLSCVYKRDASGKPVIENGEAVVARVLGTVNGKPVDLNGDSLKLRVVQSGENIGDLHVVHAGGKYKEIVRIKDFAKESFDHTSDRPDLDDWRIRSIVKADGPRGWESGSYRTYAYDDAHQNPTRPTKIITANHTQSDTLKVTMELKENSSNEYRTFTSDPNDKNIRDRKLANFDLASGDFAYSESKYKWQEVAQQPTNVADGGVKEARKELMRTLSEHGLVNDRTREYLDKFEGNTSGWVQRYRDKGWEAPSNKRIAATYRALASLFDGQTLVSQKERDTYAVEQVAQLGEPTKNFQQRDVGTCAVVGELSALMRVVPDELVGHCVEAMKYGRITSTGVDKSGNHQKFKVDPKSYPDNRRYIDQLQQNMLTSTLGIEHTTTRYGGTYGNETSYMYNFISGRHDTFTARRGTSSEDVLLHLRHGNARLSCLNDSHIKDIEDARMLKDGSVEFFVHNWWSWENGTYGPGTGWYKPESIGLRPLTNTSNYLRDLGRK